MTQTISTEPINEALNPNNHIVTNLETRSLEKTSRPPAKAQGSPLPQQMPNIRGGANKGENATDAPA